MTEATFIAVECADQARTLINYTDKGWVVHEPDKEDKECHRYRVGVGNDTTFAVSVEVHQDIYMEAMKHTNMAEAFVQMFEYRFNEQQDKVDAMLAEVVRDKNEVMSEELKWAAKEFNQKIHDAAAFGLIVRIDVLEQYRIQNAEPTPTVEVKVYKPL